MSLKCPLGILGVSVLLGYTAIISEAATLAEIKTTQEKTFRQINENYRTDVEKLAVQLSGALQRGKEAATKAGDEELAKTYQTELELIELVGEPQSLASTVPSINKMQAIYRSARDERTGKMHRSIVAWQKAADADLALLENKLKNENDLANAAETASERGRLAALVDESVDAVEALDAASDLKPKAPVAAAATSTGPWQSLTKLRWKEIDGSKYFLGMIEENNGIEFGGKKYKKRDLIYTHAPGKVVYEFKDPITEFSVTGCLEERSGNGNVLFIVKTEEGEVFRGQPVNKERNHEEITVKFKPTKQLTLMVDENGGAQEDWAFWLLPRFR